MERGGLGRAEMKMKRKNRKLMEIPRGEAVGDGG